MFSKVNGGLEQVFLNYVPTLTLQGNQVISVVHPKAQILDDCPKENLKTIHNYNQYDPFAIYRLRQLIHTEKPDCIITHSYRAAYLFKKTKTKVPKIAVCHVKGHYDFGTDAIIAITEQMRQDIINFGKPAHSVFTIPNMIHIPHNLTYKEPRENEVPIIGACARFAPIKGIDILIEALAELKTRKIVFKAKIAGDGKEKEHYIQLIKHHKLQDEVTLLGWVEDRHSFYESIDLFCLPSREEAFGLVVLESMMHSLPMVLSELSGPTEIIGNSESAIFVEPENPISFADGLEHIICNKNYAKQLSYNAFQRVQQFSNRNVGPLLHNVLTQICNNNSPSVI
jgi:glycosyltransferase involved in cell wall biosynthesis